MNFQQVWFCSYLMFVLFCGCNSKYNVAPVSGTVTLDGMPLEDVTVTFTPKSKASNSPISSGRTDSQGQYRLSVVIDETEGAAIGTNNVDFVSNATASSDVMTPAERTKLNSLDQVFSFEVKPEKNTADFRIESKKKK
jgi:hypothetical protein